MKAHFVAAALILAVPAAADSRTLIAGGQTFMLGGEQTQPFLVEGRNAGAVPVTVLAAGKAGEKVIAILAPRQEVAHVFAAGETALFRNSAGRQAVMALKLTDQVSGLSMRYDREARR
jgi:hypothetical protein